MKTDLKKILVAIFVLLILDILWINFYMGGQYKKMVPKIQGSELEMKFVFAMFAYVLMVVGLVFFVLPNISDETPMKDSLLYGGLFGIILYGVYDFTAGAVLKDWDTPLAMKDIAWGGFVYTAAAMSTVLV